MSKLDEYKESLNTLRVILSIVTGMFALGVGSLIARYDTGRIDAIFWLGILACLMAIIILAIIFLKIIRKTKEIGEL
jgi:hypothetical protein